MSAISKRQFTQRLLWTPLAATLMPISALAQDWPSKPIKLVVPYAAGGPIDVTARALAERVKDSLGTVIIENRPGAGGNLEQTVTKNNLEAAEEVVRQLRLRDIGGIIVIDFIDMVLESNRDLVLRRLTEALAVLG